MKAYQTTGAAKRHQTRGDALLIRTSLFCVVAAALLFSLPVSVARAEPGTGQIRVATDPAGATVTCDGIEQEAATVTIRGLAAGPHLVIVKKAGFVEARRTVVLMTGQRLAVDFRLEPARGLVLVQSSPSDADVEIDGAHRGKTPLLLTDLGVGKYRMKLTTPGYLPREIELVVGEDRIPQRVQVDLPSDSAKLVVNSTPTGATVTVNGIVRGTTPCDVDRLPGGENKLVASLPDYVPSQRELKLQAGDVHRIDVTLKPLPGALSVVSVPAGARICVDDQFKGEAPVVLDTLEPGTHAVKAELKGYESETRSVEVIKGGTKVEEFRLSRNAGMMELVTEPPEVTVTVDGEDRGTTAAGGSEAVSLPYKVDGLSTGEHSVVLSKKGFFSLEKRIVIAVDQAANLRVLLKRKFVPDTQVRTSTGSGESLIGCVSRRLPNGDLELETKPGIFVKIKADEILSVEPLGAEEKK